MSAMNKDNAHSMFPLNRRDLAYEFAAIADDMLRENKDADAADIVAALIPQLVVAVPDGAFTPIEPSQAGLILLHGKIDDEGVSGIHSELIQMHLNLDKRMSIRIHLSSAGGEVYNAMAIVSTIYELQRAGRVVDVLIQGRAMSMASVIAQVANRRYMESSAQMMLHMISYGIDGHTADHVSELESTEKTHAAMFEIYSARTGKPAAYYAELLRHKTVYLNAAEALAEGFVDEILAAPLYPTAMPTAKSMRIPRKSAPRKKRT